MLTSKNNRGLSAAGRGADSHIYFFIFAAFYSQARLPNIILRIFTGKMLRAYTYVGISLAVRNTTLDKLGSK